MDASHETTTLSPRLAAALLAIAASLPFVLSLVFTSLGSSAQQPATATARPALAFDQYMVNLGPIPPRLHATATFGFHNVGGKPVKITKLEPSCGCLKPRLDSYNYAPGESGGFQLKIEIPGETPGPKEYTVKVHYEDPEPRETMVTFKVTLPEPQVAVHPPGLQFHQSGVKETRKSVYITDYRAQPLEVVKVESDSEFATARVVPVEGTPDPRLTRVEVTVLGNVPPGTHTANVLVRTSDPAYPTLKVGLEISGQRSFSEQAEEALGIQPVSGER